MYFLLVGLHLQFVLYLDLLIGLGFVNLLLHLKLDYNLMLLLHLIVLDLLWYLLLLYLQ